MIYTRDHPPAHVHIRRQGKKAVIEFKGRVYIRDNFGFHRRELATAQVIVEENHDG